MFSHWSTSKVSGRPAAPLPNFDTLHRKLKNSNLRRNCKVSEDSHDLTRSWFNFEPALAAFSRFTRIRLFESQYWNWSSTGNVVLDWDLTRWKNSVLLKKDLAVIITFHTFLVSLHQKIVVQHFHCTLNYIKHLQHNICQNFAFSLPYFSYSERYVSHSTTWISEWPNILILTSSSTTSSIHQVIQCTCTSVSILHLLIRFLLIKKQK